MSKETYLQKQFKESDVKRMRNIASKKYGDNTKTQVGYEKIDEVHKEGDIWEDSGKIWTIKDGIKRTYSKLRGLKDQVRIPFGCPKCQGAMKSKIDKKMYSIHQTCFNCVIQMESALKREGKYEEYAKNFMNNNLKLFLREAKDFIREYSVGKDDSIVSENGEVEDWEGGINGRKRQVEIWLRELEEMELNLKK